MSHQGPRRSVFRFSIRTMLILTTVFAVFLGNRLHRASRQRRAVQRIEEIAAGSVIYDDGRSGSRSLNWFYDAIASDFLHSVTSVTISGSKFQFLNTGDPVKHYTDDDWDELTLAVGALDSIRWLRLENVTPKQVESFARCKNLEELSLRTVEDSYASSIRKLEWLRRLSSGTRFSQNGILELAGHPRLEHVFLNPIYRHRIDDDAAQALSTMPNLRLLDVSSTLISDQGVEMLSALKRLERLNVSYTGITDDSIEHLSEMKSLRTLNLDRTSITEAGAERLRAALPRTYITFSRADQSNGH